MKTKLIANFNIPSCEDRSSMVAILNHAGYITKINMIKDNFLYNHQYFVEVYEEIFEKEDDKNK